MISIPLQCLFHCLRRLIDAGDKLKSQDASARVAGLDTVDVCGVFIYDEIAVSTTFQGVFVSCVFQCYFFEGYELSHRGLRQKPSVENSQVSENVVFIAQ